jgi:hypothetical protein
MVSTVTVSSMTHLTARAGNRRFLPAKRPARLYKTAIQKKKEREKH